ncbi:hypothetical protein LCGC14_0697390 [marine sediment metagenome]|uniref:Leucine-rich repeat domain-containing protein n=1 Tax=marine sediment metagenome TaxID=412755 RepID=A0A0F9QNJ5_9ZZZZ
MNEPLSPKIIYNQFLSREINKQKAADLLTSLIEVSDNTKFRAKSIDLLEKIGIINNRGFKVLENCLISDENAIVRASSVKLILNYYLDEGLTLLEWVIEHERSPLVLKLIFDYVDNCSNQKFKRIKKKISDWNEKFSSLIRIVPEESRFFLDLEAIFAKDKENYEIEPTSYTHFKDLSDYKDGEPWLLIKNEHVHVLNYNYFNWKFIKENREIIRSHLKLNDLKIYFKTINKYNINTNNQELPPSISRLTHLRKLVLKRNYFRIIPSSIRRLSLLKELDLSHNALSKIPQVLGSLNSLEILNIKHNKVQNIPKSLKLFLNLLKEFQF